MSSSDIPLSKYEAAKVVGVRSEMLARGAAPLVPLTDDLKMRGCYHPALIAERELATGAIPFNIIRHSVTGRTVRLQLHREDETSSSGTPPSPSC